MANQHNTPAITNNRLAGFTLIELVVIVVILGVMAAVVAVRYQSNVTYTLPQQADLLARYLRHVQALAVGWNRELTLTPAAGGYGVTCVTGGIANYCVNAGDTVRDPATGELLNLALADGATLAGSSFSFDKWGRPKSGASLLSSPRAWVLSGAGSTYTVSVAPVTGFVTVASP